MLELDPIDVSIGSRVRARREALRITQVELAKDIGVTFQQVQKYEKGTNRIAAARLLQIARVLQTTAASLLGEDGEGNIPGADALARQWSQIEDPKQRRAVVDLVRTMIAS